MNLKKHVLDYEILVLRAKQMELGCGSGLALCDSWDAILIGIDNVTRDIRRELKEPETKVRRGLTTRQEKAEAWVAKVAPKRRNS